MEIIELLAHRKNYGAQRSENSIKYIVFHYTGNSGDKAKSNAVYYSRELNPHVSAHYFVDDDSIYQSVPDLFTAYSVGGSKYVSCGTTGGGKMYGVISNTNSISIEMCGTGSGTTSSKRTMENAIWLCQKLMHKYGVPIDHVYRHFDVTGKMCPAFLIANSDWESFKAKIVINGGTSSMDNTPTPAFKDSVEWAVRNGIIKGTVDGDLRLHSNITVEKMCEMLHRFHDKNF